MKSNSYLTRKLANWNYNYRFNVPYYLMHLENKNWESLEDTYLEDTKDK